MVSMAKSESNPSACQKSEEITLGVKRHSGVQQCVELIQQQIVKEDIELQKCKAIIKKMMAAVPRQKNISMDVKPELHSLEGIETNLFMCRKARQTLQANIVGPVSEIDLTEMESTTKKIEVATRPIRVGKGKGKKDKYKEHEEIRENDDFLPNECT